MTPPKDDAAMAALVEQIEIRLLNTMPGNRIPTARDIAWVINSLSHADLKFLAERDGTMRVVPVNDLTAAQRYAEAMAWEERPIAPKEPSHD